MEKAQYWIDGLSLNRHPEGGWYKELYRSNEVIALSHLPSRFSGNRAFATSIYFLFPFLVDLIDYYNPFVLTPFSY